MLSVSPGILITSRSCHSSRCASDGQYIWWNKQVYFTARYHNALKLPLRRVEKFLCKSVISVWFPFQGLTIIHDLNWLWSPRTEPLLRFMAQVHFCRVKLTVIDTKHMIDLALIFLRLKKNCCFSRNVHS